MALVRLNRILASKGFGSRREADKIIEAGWVKVNGVVAHLGQKIEDEINADIEVDAAARDHKRANLVTVILHKPLGVVSCQPTKDQTPAIKLLVAANEDKFQGKRRTEPYKLPKLAVAGRLDVNSTGLLLFTQCGLTASKIVGPDSTVEKEYLIRLKKSEDRLSLRHTSKDIQDRLARLRQGVECDGELLTAVNVDVVNSDQLRMTLKQGKKHQIRRMMKAVGWGIQALKRVRIGNIKLENLALGQWRYLKPNEKI